jgi:hypothetical protein
MQPVQHNLPLVANILPNATAVEQRSARQIDANASKQSCSVTLDATAV